MKLSVLDMQKKEEEKVDLPEQFSEPIRDDIIKKVVISIQGNNRQPYGSDPRAGMKHSAELSRRRRKYRGSYGFGISRVPRKILSRRGTRFNWAGAQMPGTVGGRRAHPPKAIKVWNTKINKKENRLAIRCALSATVVKDAVAKRGHRVPDLYPFIISDTIESVKKTSEVRKALENLGFSEEFTRIKQKKIRAGKGKARGRKYKKRVGPLLVVSKECELSKAARNMQGIDVVLIDRLNTVDLAPGCIPGRLTLYTNTAIKRLREEKLFM